MKEYCLSEKIRAEDILLGSLGLDGDAKIISVESTSRGYRGIARWPDGEELPFQSDEEVDELQRWALKILS